MDNVTEATLQASKTAEQEREAHRWKDTWRYEKPVMAALDPYMTGMDKSEKRAFLVLVEKEARRTSTRKWGEEWDGPQFVAAVLGGVIAYLTPGFLEAKRYNDLYGS